MVSVTEDAFVSKGPNRPHFQLDKRMSMIRALAIVDSVISAKTAVEAINRIKPNIYVKGKEYVGKLAEQKLVESYGGKVVFTEGPVLSSTDLIAKYGLEIPRLSDW